MNMFKYIKNQQLVTDRQVATIHCQDSDQSCNFLQQPHSRFIMMMDGTITFDNSDKISGCFSASVNTGFNVSGIGMVIDTPGYLMPNQSITRFTPGILGNLSYIDGCSNSNLIDPPRSGDPCINYLYFPPGINQTFHTHPSYRIGLVLSGYGYAETVDDKKILETGTMFILERHTLHRFFTEDSHLSLMVFHPDSEDGPRDEFNPMKSRTYLK
jgi:hypothetical protein